jgi:hypothetical protein
MEANEPIRNSFVINLDSPPGGAQGGRAYQSQRKSRRWPRILAIFLILVFFVVLAAAVGGFFWWRHFQTTPTYSLALIIDAAQRNDMPSFDKHIDDDAIAQNLMAEVRQKAAERYGIALSDSVQKQIDSLLPTLVPKLKQKVHEEVAKEIKEFASKTEPKPFILIALAVPSLVSITTEGDNARAKAPLTDRTVELALKKDGDLWKVTEFKDEVLLQRVVDSVMKDLPAIGGLKLDIPLLKQGKKSRRR